MPTSAELFARAEELHQEADEMSHDQSKSEKSWIRYDWRITSYQWIYVVLFTLLGCAAASSSIGLVALPIWYLLATLGSLDFYICSGILRNVLAAGAVVLALGFVV